MPTESRHFSDELQDLLDGRLDPETAAVVQRHLEDCVACQRELAALRWTKTFAAAHFAAGEAPADLEERIAAALQDERLRSGAKIIRPSFWRQRRRAILAAAALLAVAALIAGSYFRLRASLPESLAENYHAYQRGSLALASETRDVRQMEIYFDEHGVPFKTRVFDLAMMNYRLVGGKVQRLRGRESALFVYRGPGGHPLLCQMYSGSVAELPTGAIRQRHNGIDFYRYEIGGLTVVFWPESGVMCALVSEIAPQEVLRLAFAKAARPAASGNADG